jgi:Rad3-related DNA helicase
MYADRHEEDPMKQTEVEQCENFLRKYEYCLQEIKQDRPWVVNISPIRWPGKEKKTKKIELKPVDVDRFLKRFIWSRGSKRVISSATIPYRNNIDTWADRLGLDGETELISKPMPFPEEHRQIHTNTIVGPMSGGNEDEIWSEVVEKLQEIHSHHEGERGLIHTASYQRAEKVADALGDDVLLHEQGEDKEQLIEHWVGSAKDILVSPSMTEGVDLYGDRCRWQVLLKVPFGYAGDSRVSFLLNSRKDWTWYYQTTSCDVQQSVGRAVRGPESFEAASFYVIDEKFGDVVTRTAPPDWFTEAITDQAPEHWEDEQAAPWRNDDDHD